MIPFDKKKKRHVTVPPNYNMSFYFLSEIPYLEVSACFSLLILLGDILTLIVQLLTFGKSNLYLHQTSLEIYL